MRRAQGRATLSTSEPVENPAVSRVRPKPLADSLSPTPKNRSEIELFFRSYQEALWAHLYKLTRQRARFPSSGVPLSSIV